MQFATKFAMPQFPPARNVEKFDDPYGVVLRHDRHGVGETSDEHENSEVAKNNICNDRKF